MKKTQESPDPAGPRKRAASGSRRISREMAVQGLYQYLLTGYSVELIEKQLREEELLLKADVSFFVTLLRGTIAQMEPLQEKMRPHLDRAPESLDPVERAVLLLGTYELAHHPDVPYRVVINEGVELAKLYGGTDGHRYVNGVLDKLAAELRAIEVQHAGGQRKPR